MARLIRMDSTGHSTLAEWTVEDQAGYEAAVHEFRRQLDEGYIGVVDEGPGKATQIRELLGDLLGHRERELQRETGLALERGGFGVWLVGEGGALLLTPGGRRVHCFCVRVTDPELPPSDRIAHLLLALRSDEAGFTTVANHAFAGAPWRVRRRLPREMRPALAAAREAARAA